MLDRREHKGVVWYESPILRQAGCPHGFSTRRGGVSEGPFESLNCGYTRLPSRPDGDEPEAVAENTHRLISVVGIDRPLGNATQVHGNEVVLGRDIEPNIEADALVALSPVDGAVGVRTADCCPILIASRTGQAVAAVHAGWRGMVGGVIANAVREMRRHLDEPTKLLAAVGPCIGVDAFEVGPEVAEQFIERFGQSSGVVLTRAHWPKPHIDLVSAAVISLKSLEIDVIDAADLCTVEREDEFFSHRRDDGVTGRMLSVIRPR